MRPSVKGMSLWGHTSLKARHPSASCQMHLQQGGAVWLTTMLQDACTQKQLHLNLRPAYSGSFNSLKELGALVSKSLQGAVGQLSRCLPP